MQEKHEIMEVEHRLHELFPFLTYFLTEWTKRGKSAGDLTLEETQAEIIAIGAALRGDPADVISSSNEVWQLIRFVHFGQKVYEVGAGLAQALANTRVGNLDMSWIRLPVPSLYVHFPYGEVYMRGYDGTPIRIEGFLLTEHVCAEKRRLAIALLSKKKEGDHIGITLALHLWQEGSLEAAIRGLVKLITEQIEQDASLLQVARFPSKTAFLRACRTDIEAVTTLVINTLLYITCSDAEMRRVESPRTTQEKHCTDLKHRKQQKLREKLKKYSGLERTLLGESIVIQRPTNVSGAGEKTDRTLAVRFQVQGHWRQQAVGPNHSERRLTWIQPYWKGPENADVLARKHLLK